MGIKDQFKDRAQQLADQAKEAKQGAQRKQGKQQSPRGPQDEAQERIRGTREDRDPGMGQGMPEDEMGEGPERYRS